MDFICTKIAESLVNDIIGRRQLLIGLQIATENPEVWLFLPLHPWMLQKYFSSSGCWHRVHANVVNVVRYALVYCSKTGTYSPASVSTHRCIHCIYTNCRLFILHALVMQVNILMRYLRTQDVTVLVLTILSSHWKWVLSKY